MTNPFAGTWTYRSFLNDPALTNGDPQRLAALLFAEGTWTVKDGPPTIFVGELSFGADFIMDLKGVISPAAEDGTAHVHIIGSGRDGTPSADYFYDYDGSLTEQWPKGGSTRSPRLPVPSFVSNHTAVSQRDLSPRLSL